ncbi:unnamed protein product, partial [Ectocarpus fasciculatus]
VRDAARTRGKGLNRKRIAGRWAAGDMSRIHSLGVGKLASRGDGLGQAAGAGAIADSLSIRGTGHATGSFRSPIHGSSPSYPTAVGSRSTKSSSYSRPVHHRGSSGGGGGSGGSGDRPRNNSTSSADGNGGPTNNRTRTPSSATDAQIREAGFSRNGSGSGSGRGERDGSGGVGAHNSGSGGGGGSGDGGTGRGKLRPWTARQRQRQQPST